MWFASIRDMRIPRNHGRFLLLTILMTIAGGCATDRPAWRVESEQKQTQERPYEVTRGWSMALDTPEMAALPDTMPEGYLPWYAARNDHRRSASITPAYESTVIYTRDRQYQSGGRVYDVYNSTTYRTRIIETAP